MLIQKLITTTLSAPAFLRILSAVIYCFCITAMSLLPPQKLPEVPLFKGADKLVHFMMYFILSFLLCWTFYSDKKKSRAWIVIGLSVTWGMLMEIAQFSMHLGRSFSWFDMVANILGIIFGILIYYFISVRLWNQISSQTK